MTIDRREGTTNRPVQPPSKSQDKSNGPTRGDTQPSQRRRGSVPFPTDD